MENMTLKPIMKQTQFAWQHFLNFWKSTPAQPDNVEALLPECIEEVLIEKTNPVDEKLKGFDVVRDILVVPSSERGYIRSGIHVIGLDDVHNVARVRV